MIRLAMSLMVIALWLLPHTAHAFDGTGTELQQACNQPKGTQDHTICVAYVSGVYEGMWASQRLLVSWW